MKKLYFTFLTFFFLALSVFIHAQERYLEPIFDGNDVETVTYATNISVLTGSPEAVTLEADIYTPAGDTATNRPLFLYFHTGNFLPNPINGSTGGTRNDSTVMEIVDRLTSLGYVVAVVEYRMGWNPLGDLDTRISTLLNAAYRGIQDARSAVRFFRKDAVDHGNNFGIDPNKIAYFGQGTGGYISLAASTLDAYQNILIPKFFEEDEDGNLVPYVIEQVHGDPFGTSDAAISLANTVNYEDGTPINSDVQLTVNIGGALADTSWITPNNPPMISFHVPTDGFAPYTEGVLIVPTTGDQIVEVQGSYLVQYKANELGLNDVFINAGLDDPFTHAANVNNDGFEGLFPFIRPIWTNPFNQQPAPENAPWEWWDPEFWSTFDDFPHPSCPAGAPLSQCNFHIINSIVNQDMSPEKGRTYIDSIIVYLVPRAFVAFDLDVDTEVRDLNKADIDFTLYPNPSSGVFKLESEIDMPMLKIEIFDSNGRLIRSFDAGNFYQYQLNLENFAKGMYYARIHFDQGVLSERLIVQ